MYTRFVQTKLKFDDILPTAMQFRDKILNCIHLGHQFYFDKTEKTFYFQYIDATACMFDKFTNCICTLIFTVIGRKNKADQEVLQIIWNIPSQFSSCLLETALSTAKTKVVSVSFFLPINCNIFFVN